jgi:hypothetical protein
MVDMGFWPDVRRIVETLPADRQTLLFSATTSHDVMKAAQDIMRAPKMMQVGKSGGLASTITHVSHHLPTDAKAGWLDTFLAKTPQHALVFVRTKHRADRLVQTLAARGHRCAPLHANRTQRERHDAVQGFKSGHVRCSSPPTSRRGGSTHFDGHVINSSRRHVTPTHRPTAARKPRARRDAGRTRRARRNARHRTGPCCRRRRFSSNVVQTSRLTKSRRSAERVVGLRRACRALPAMVAQTGGQALDRRPVLQPKMRGASSPAATVRGRLRDDRRHLDEHAGLPGIFVYALRRPLDVRVVVVQPPGRTRQ